MSRSEQEVLREALTHVDLMLEDAQGGVMDQLVVDGVCMRLSAGVEVSNRLDASVRTGFFGDSWTFMWGVRNRIAHGYLLIDPAIIRRTLETDIPTIMTQIHRALGEDPGRSRNPRSGG